MRTIVIRAIIISVITNAIAILSGYFGWNIQLAVVGLVFFAAGILYKPINFKSSPLYYLLMVIPFALIFDLHVFMDRLEDVYPIALMPYIALLFGMLLSKKSGQKSYILYGAIGLYIIVMILSWQFFMPSYLTYSFNKEFHALEDNNLDFPELEVYNSSKEKVDLHIFDNKVLVLDIWTRSCGICFKRFPDFEALSQQYKGREDIVFYALNKLNYNDNLDSIISLANNLPYEFPHLFTLPSWNGEIKEKLNVSYFPMMVVRTKNGKLIYIGGGSTVYEKGTYRNAKSVIDDLL